jgi:hypothetical protein
MLHQVGIEPEESRWVDPLDRQIYIVGFLSGLQRRAKQDHLVNLILPGIVQNNLSLGFGYHRISFLSAIGVRHETTHKHYTPHRRERQRTIKRNGVYTDFRTSAFLNL